VTLWLICLTLAVVGILSTIVLPDARPARPRGIRVADLHNYSIVPHDVRMRLAYVIEPDEGAFIGSWPTRNLWGR